MTMELRSSPFRRTPAIALRFFISLSSAPVRTISVTCLTKELHTCRLESATIYTQYIEMLKICYRRSLTYDNIMRRFKSTGVWCPSWCGVVPEVINARDFTHLNGHRTAQQALTGYQELVQKYKAATLRWRSDGESIGNGTVNTTSGAMLTDLCVLRLKEEREAKHANVQASHGPRRQVAELRRIERETLPANSEAARTARQHLLAVRRVERESRRRDA